jgi:hypothetical protein
MIAPMTSTKLETHTSQPALPSNRKFGLVSVIVFLVIGVWPALFGSGTPHIWAFATALAFLTFTVVASDFLEPLNKIWMRVAELLLAVINPLILGIIFFGVITPVAILMRLCGKDILNLKRSPNLQSYWIDRHPPGPKPETLPRQF